MGKLTANFSTEEFACHDGTPVPKKLQANLLGLAVGVLQPIRERWGAPIVVLSGYRTPAWNKRVGGAKASTHMTAEGADIRCTDPADLPAFTRVVEDMIAADALAALGGLGKYKGWLHVDTKKKPNGKLRRWTGTGVGSEP